MSYRAALHRELEQAAFRAEERMREIQRELQREANPQQRAVLKIRLQEAHQENQRCLQALFSVGKA